MTEASPVCSRSMRAEERRGRSLPTPITTAARQIRRSAPIDTSGVTNPAPQAVYQTDRYGTFTYSKGGASPHQPLIVRLHFAELTYNTRGAARLQRRDQWDAGPVQFRHLRYCRRDGQGRHRAVPRSSRCKRQRDDRLHSGRRPAASQRHRSRSVKTFSPARRSTLRPVAPRISPPSKPITTITVATLQLDATHAVDTSGVPNPPPQGVYANQRTGATQFQYVFTGLPQNTAYNLRLDFVETQYNGAGSATLQRQRQRRPVPDELRYLCRRRRNVQSDGQDGHGQRRHDRETITVVFTSVHNNAKVNGLELSAATTATPPPFSSKIQHVVVIIQENRSFDNLFNGFPGADTAQSGINSQGQTIPLAQVPLELQHDPAHNHTSFVTAYDQRQKRCVRSRRLRLLPDVLAELPVRLRSAQRDGGLLQLRRTVWRR